MPQLYKATAFIQYGRGGFSYSHHIMGVSHNQVMLYTEDLVDKYLACCGTNVMCNYLRVSEEGVKGDSVVEAKIRTTSGPGVVNPNSQHDIKSAVSDTPDAWWNAALLRLGSSAVVYGRQFMRGIPDQIVILPNGLANDANWQKALDRYFAELVKRSWGMFAVPRSAGYRKAIKKFTSLAPAGTVEIETLVPHGLAPGNKFMIGGFGPQSAKLSPNGEWVVESAADVTHLTVAPSQGMTFPAAYKRAGELWSKEKSFHPYDSEQLKLIRLTERKAGRPSDSLVGRRKRK